MKAYIITTAGIFGLLTVAHLVRIVAERQLATEPLFLVFTIVSAALCAWGLYVWRALKA